MLFSQHSLTNFQAFLIQGFCFSILSLLLIHPCQIIVTCCRVRMLFSQYFFFNFQTFLIQGFRFPVPSFTLIHICQIIVTICRIGMLFSQYFFYNFQTFLIQIFRFLIPSLLLIYECQRMINLRQFQMSIPQQFLLSLPRIREQSFTHSILCLFFCIPCLSYQVIRLIHFLPFISRLASANDLPLFFHERHFPLPLFTFPFRLIFWKGNPKFNEGIKIIRPGSQPLIPIGRSQENKILPQPLNHIPAEIQAAQSLFLLNGQMEIDDKEHLGLRELGSPCLQILKGIVTGMLPIIIYFHHAPPIDSSDFFLHLLVGHHQINPLF